MFFIVVLVIILVLFFIKIILILVVYKDIKHSKCVNNLFYVTVNKWERKIQSIKDKLEINKMNKIVDLYRDFLTIQNKYKILIGFLDWINGSKSYVKITRFLNSKLLVSKKLWFYIKLKVNNAKSERGILILDNSIQEKPYINKSKIMC